jgi:phosphoglycerol transferase MdoB-like AlkP superfamily enzyme
MNFKLPNNRYSILFAFILLFLAISFVVRTVLLIVSAKAAGITFTGLLRIYSQGFIFDLGVAVFFSVLYSIYLLLLPQKWNNSKVNRILTYTGFFVVLFIIMFSFFAEFTFWQEFESRFNFIAVDYLVYTYEVINNINESYPLPLLIGGMLLFAALILWLLVKRKVFSKSFRSATSFSKRLALTVSILAIAAFYLLFVKNAWAEQGNNRYHNELSKAGIYSFFAAYKNNEINYDHFYRLIDRKEAFHIVRTGLAEEGATFLYDDASIRRKIENDSLKTKPNVIMITIESFSADFMKAFGNTQNLTPFLDSLAENSVLFTNMYATGTRTIRGMEALSLSIPPTPGSSIVRRPDNDRLFTVGSIFKNAGYERAFVYGGDGYFDNMNQYFGSNGFDIIDRGRNLMVGDDFNTKRTIIADKDVHFENAWGISDEDLYDAVIRDADEKNAAGKPFYDFVMTTSNHKPFTYPDGKIDIPSKTGREGAVKYTDYAIKQLFAKIKNKPWYNNTVVILVADHCASSAGKNEIDISKYHIPAMIVNLKETPNRKIDKMSSQIDLYPTLFALMGWSYETNFFGKNVLSDVYDPRIVLGTYQKLAYLKKDSLVILGPQQAVETFIYDKTANQQKPAVLPAGIVNEAVAQYQAAYYLYKNKGLKESVPPGQK